ncbi:Chorismate synthase [Rhynchospora pubera]|uniref:Chorismate synthase n=1 Tax=Rhynchospora pubera TaxID=906938 RepID=A0AAV8DY62_9POAL|nr:Chorismate synthase [Rhynchospora pubera]
MAVSSIGASKLLVKAGGIGSQPSDLRRLSLSPVQISVRPRGHAPARRSVEVQASGNVFGSLFQVSTFGESHGGGVGCTISGCPPNVPISEADIQFELDRRRPGQSRITTPRKETDTCTIQSGVSDKGLTLGSPIHIFVPNTDQRGKDYSEMALAYRPSHADATYDFKYGIRAVQGGGRSSARETIGRVAAGAVAKKILKMLGTEVLAYVSQVHKVVLPDGVVDHETLTMEQIESNIVRCPDPEYAQKMIEAIDVVRVRGDSIGGVVTCIARNVPRGLGQPVFDKLEAELAKAMLSLPATKGFEFGSGFAGTFLMGSEHNDEFYVDPNGKIRTKTNRSGGIQGGISNGEIINMRIAFKPTATIGKKQYTVTRDREETELIARGRHDPCVVPRAVPMAEAMAALVLVNQLMAQKAQNELLPFTSPLQEPIPTVAPLNHV